MKDLFDPLLGESAWAGEVFLVVLGTGLAHYLARLILARVGRGLAQTKNLYDDALLEAARKPLSWGIWLIGVSWAAELAGGNARAEIFGYVGPIRDTGVIVLLAWFAVRFITFVELHVSDTNYRDKPTDPTTASAVGKLLRASVIITGALMVLQTLGFSVSGVLAFGGIGGIINASYNLNLGIHNTAWVAGHFHLTVGAASTLTFFGISYWLVPKLRGRQLFSTKMALGQAWTWFFGMLIFANAYHSLGLYYGAPRRSMLGAAPYATAEWTPILMYSSIGLFLLFISATLYFINIFATVLISKKLDKEIVMPVAEPLDPTPAPKWLDTWWPWVNGAVFLLLLSYGPMLYQLFRDSQWIWPGRVVW